MIALLLATALASDPDGYTTRKTQLIQPTVTWIRFPIFAGVVGPISDASYDRAAYGTVLEHRSDGTFLFRPEQVFRGPWVAGEHWARSGASTPRPTSMTS